MMELFDKKFVRFMWDDELEGKEGFCANDICKLVNYVHSGDSHRIRVGRNLSPVFPFKDTFNNDWLFFYYDPNYEIKKAFNEGKKIQVHCANGTWKDCDAPKWYDYCMYRIKPEEKWIAYLVRKPLMGKSCYLTTCREDNWEKVQEEFAAKTKLFVGSESDAQHWYESRQKFADVIKAWEDGKKIQVLDTNSTWINCDEPQWYDACEYRVKPDCPCEVGIDSKACVGCEYSEDGKKEQNSITEILIQELNDFPPVNLKSKLAFERVIKCLSHLAKRIDSIENAQKKMLKYLKQKR